MRARLRRLLLSALGRQKREAVLLNLYIERQTHFADWLRRGAQALCLMLLLTAQTEASTAPVGWWKFDEGSGPSTTDSSGNGATGALTNSPSWVAGRIAPGALSFNGATQSVAVNGAGAIANLYTTGLTVSAWIKPAGLGGGSLGRIVDKDNNDQGWFFGLGPNNTIKFASDQFSGTSPSLTSANSAITLNTWQHVVATWDGSTSGSGIHLYINGVLLTGTTAVNGANNGTTYSDITTPLTIGNRPVDNARGFNGLIDEVRVYNRILSSAEIQALADSVAPTAPGGLSASAASSSQINLVWTTASTDSVGVTSYLIERCLGGAGCSSFSQVGTSTAMSYSDMGLTASTTYSYRIRATDANTNYSGYSNTYVAATSASSPPPVPAAVSYIYDSLGRLQKASYDTGITVKYGLDPAGNRTNVTTGPPTPDNFTATAVSTSQVNLSWTALPQATGYKLFRVGSSTPFATPTGTTYNDTSLSAYTLYQYNLVATYPAGAVSGQATASATTFALPPNPPTTVSASGASQTAMNVSWSGATDPSGPGISQYGVYRDGSLIATTASTSYIDTGLTGWSTHNYWIVTYDRSTPALTSGASSTATGRTLDTTPPNVPTGFTSTTVSNTQVNLSWNATTDNGGSGVGGYAIFSALDSNGRVTGVAYSTTGTTYAMTGLTPGASYNFYLEAYDNAVPPNYSAYTAVNARVLPFNDPLTVTQGNLTWQSLTCYGDVPYNMCGQSPYGVGNIAPVTLTGGRTVDGFYDISNNTAHLQISGFPSDPGKTWLISATNNATGVSKTGSAAGYAYQNGVAYWAWSGTFGFVGSGNVGVSINHN